MTEIDRTPTHVIACPRVSLTVWLLLPSDVHRPYEARDDRAKPWPDAARFDYQEASFIDLARALL